jgi:poly-gamma-glutamate synthesis protein (capsule biosynthesis protein)
MADSVLMIVTGDIHPNREKPETLFQAVKPLLDEGDLRVAQLECTISDKGTCRTDVRNPTHQVPPHNIKALTAAGYNVITFAGNNNLDYGLEGFYDTIDRLKAANIQVVGAGRNLAEARRPVVVERKGIRIAFIDACSILRDGYEARENRAGIAPLTVKTFYEPLENIYEQPGTPARTVTIPDADELEIVLKSIRDAKQHADIVVACFHWGIHFTHDLAMYQAEVGYAAIDAGADLVLGSHPHCLQAIDVYKGKFIVYSLGNFAFEMPEKAAQKGVGEYLSFYGIPLDPDVPTHPHPSHCRRAGVLRVTLSKRGVERLAFVPTLFTTKGIPEHCPAGSEGFREIVTLMQELCAPLGTALTVKGDEVLISPQKQVEVDTRTLLRRRKFSYPSLRQLATHAS